MHRNVETPRFMLTLGLVSIRRRHLALCIAGALMAGLCAYSTWVHWRAARDRADATAVSGEGLVIYSDGLGYYAWLRSLMCDGDWSFDDEFDQHNPGGNALPLSNCRTERGLRCNQWSVGPACVWSLVVVPGHIVLRSCPSSWPSDGYSLPYQLLVAVGTLLASFVGLICIHRACSRCSRPNLASLTAICVTLGTTIVYYSAIETSMAHGIGA